MIRLSAEQRALASRHVRVARDIARWFAATHGMLHLHDVLRSVAFEALSKAAHAFDPSRGVPFDKFAWYRIVGELKNAIGKESRRRSLEGAVLDAAAQIEDERPDHPDTEDDAIAQLDGITAEVMAAFVVAAAAEEQRAHGEAGLLQREAQGELSLALSQLHPEDRRLVELRYWDDLPWEAVANCLGVAERTAKDRDLKMRRRLAADLGARASKGTGGA